MKMSIYGGGVKMSYKYFTYVHRLACMKLNTKMKKKENKEKLIDIGIDGSIFHKQSSKNATLFKNINTTGHTQGFSFTIYNIQFFSLHHFVLNYDPNCFGKILGVFVIQIDTGCGSSASSKHKYCNILTQLSFVSYFSGIFDCRSKTMQHQ